MIAVYFTFPSAVAHPCTHTCSKLGTGHDSTSTVTHPNLPSISAGAERRRPQAWCLLAYMSEGLTHQHFRAPSWLVGSTPQTPSSLIHFRTCVFSSLLMLATLHHLTSDTKTQQRLDQLGLRASLAQRWMSPFVFSQLKREGSFRFNSCSGVTEDNHFLSIPGSIFLDFSFGDPLLPVEGKNHTSYTRNVRFLPKAL